MALSRSQRHFKYSHTRPMISISDNAHLVAASIIWGQGSALPFVLLMVMKLTDNSFNSGLEGDLPFIMDRIRYDYIHICSL